MTQELSVLGTVTSKTGTRNWRQVLDTFELSALYQRTFINILHLKIFFYHCLLISSVFFKTTVSTGFITECLTHYLSCSPYLRNNILEDVKKVFFFVSRLIVMTYSNFFQLIWNLQSFQWSYATFNWPFILSSYSWFFLLKFVGSLGLRMLFSYHSPPISVKSV